MKGKILNFLHEVEKVISVISIQVLSKKMDFPLKKMDLTFKGQKYIFYLEFLSIEIGETEFSFKKK